MAQFRSSSTEGSFKGNQTTVPDEVQKLQRAGERRLRGMTDAQAQLEQNRRVFERAQSINQRLTAQGSDAANRVRSQRLSTVKSNAEQAWEIEEKQNERKRKEKEATLKQLSQFSQTAFNLAAGIVKLNKENFEKKVNQLALVNSFDSDTLNSISQLDREMTMAEYQRTDFVQESVKAGKTQEWVDVTYNHLLKGGGYTNYIEVASVLKNQGLRDSTAYQEVLADSTLTPEEKERKINQIEAENVSRLTVNGKTPSAEILEEHYFPALRRAKLLAQTEIGNERRKIVEFETENQRIQQYKVAMQGDGSQLEYQAGWSLFQTKPSKENRLEFTKLALNMGSLEDNIRLKEAKFEGPNGTMVSLMDYPDTKDIIDRAINEKRREAKTLYDENVQLEYAERELKLEELADRLSNDEDRLTESDYMRIKQYAKDNFPPGHNSQVIESLADFTVTAQATPRMTEELDEYIESGYATLNGLEAFGQLPPDLRNYAIDRINKQAKILNSSEYQSAIESFDKTIKGAIKSSSGIDFVPGGYNSPDLQWYAGQQRAKFLSRLKNYSATTADINKAIELAQNDTINAIRTELDAPGAVTKTGGLSAYQDYLNSTKDDSRKARNMARSIILFSGSPDSKTNGKPDAKKWVDKFFNGGQQIIEATEVYQRTGSTAFFEELGRQIQFEEAKAPWEVQAWFAESVDGLEPIEPPTTWEAVKEDVTREQRRILFGNESATQEKVRTLREIARDRLPVRPAYQVAESRPISSFAEQARGQVTFDTGQPGIDVFFEDKKFPAVLPGIVKEVSSQYNTDGSGYGNYIVIESIDPETNEPVDVLYGHLADTAQFKQGDSISEGQIIGKQGGTGSVRSVDGTIASIDFLAPAAPGSGSMKPYANYDSLRRRIARDLGFN
jgi:murein DD-endopeptidase MepM/ murein hydrolase activator NlpD